METKLEQIAVKAVNQLPKALVREIRTPRSVGTGGGRPPPVTRWEWKRSHGRATKAPPDERGGNGHARPTAAAPLPYSTHSRHSTGPSGDRGSFPGCARVWSMAMVLLRPAGSCGGPRIRRFGYKR